MSSIEERLNADSDSWRRAGTAPPPSLDGLLTAALAPPVRRRPSLRNWWIAAACVAVVLAAAAIPFVIHSASTRSVRPGAPDAVLACPLSPPTSGVPHLPVGVDGANRMVPEETPTHVTMCLFRICDPTCAVGDSRMPLSGSEELTGDLSRVTDDLTWLPKTVPGKRRVCTTRAGLSTHYLIGLTYPHGTVWVSAEDDVNSCSGSTNGVFTSSVFLGNVAGNSFQADSWQGFTAPSPSPGSDQCDLYANGGRLGQEDAVVPDHPTSALICRDNSDLKILPKVIVKTVSSGFDGLVRELNALPTSPSTGVCTLNELEGPRYGVVFRYAQGPPVHVSLSHYSSCPVDNGSLQSTTEGSSLDLIEALLK